MISPSSLLYPSARKLAWAVVVCLGGLAALSAATSVNAQELPFEDTPGENADGAMLRSDNVSLWWERAWFGLRRAFVFNAERKAALDQQWLERLEQRAAMCAEAGDEECAERLQSRMKQAATRAEKHLERHEELVEKHQERFEDLRRKRQERIETLRERAVEREDQQPDTEKESDEPRSDIPEDSAKQRQDYVKSYQDGSVNSRTEVHVETQGQGSTVNLNVEQRIQNQQKFIEQRSEHLKVKLDDATTKVRIYTDETGKLIKEVE